MPTIPTIPSPDTPQWSLWVGLGIAFSSVALLLCVPALLCCDEVSFIEFDAMFSGMKSNPIKSVIELDATCVGFVASVHVRVICFS